MCYNSLRTIAFEGIHGDDRFRIVIIYLLQILKFSLHDYNFMRIWQLL
jgi:hypothetical protein